MNKEGNEEVKTISGTNVRNVSMEDLNDALTDETEDSKEEGVGVRRRQRETVSDTEERTALEGTNVRNVSMEDLNI